jgi:hypothetical protein
MTRQFSIGLIVTLLCSSALADVPSAKLLRLLPPEAGKFHQLPSVRPPIELLKENILRPDILSSAKSAEDLGITAGEADYLAPEGDKLKVEMIQTQRDADAYSLLTLIRKELTDGGTSLTFAPQNFSPALIQWNHGVAFVHGAVLVRITGQDSSPQAKGLPIELGAALTLPLDNGEGDIPVLVKHLPDWQTAQRNATYAVNIGTLTQSVPNQSILNEVSFEGDTEAVASFYGTSQLVIVEFNTPQLAGDNDRRITAKIQELRSQNQPVPSAYRRVGNYSVFVFNAPDEKSANALIDQVKYEQVVQWLGDNPHWYEKAVREWAQTSASVVVAVLESSGLALLLCLGVGGTIGALLFRHRRRLQKQAALYSDAGGMVRLDLEETTQTIRRSRLLTGKKKPLQKK